MRCQTLTAGVTALSFLGPPALAQCAWRWAAPFSSLTAPISISTPPFYGPLVAFDLDGPGPLAMDVLAIQDGVKAWRNDRWEQVPSPATADMVVLDPDGAGPAPAVLVVGGFLGVFRWSGTAWQQDATIRDGVYCLAALDEDGEGPGPAYLCAGGWFALPGQPQRGGVVRFNGSVWEPLGMGFPRDGLSRVEHLVAFDPDGLGPRPTALAAVGTFSQLDGRTARRFGIWSGGAWSLPQPPVLPSGPTTVLPGPGGEQRLALAGWTSADESLSGPQAVTLWDGVAWTTLPGQFAGRVVSLVPADPEDEGSAGRRLLASGYFTAVAGVPAARSAAFDGHAWSPIPGDIAASGPLGLARVDLDGDGPLPAKVQLAGFERLDGWTPQQGVADLTEVGWSTPYTGFDQAPDVYFTVDPDGEAGPEPALMLAGGTFHTAPGRVRARGLAAWDGQAWREFGGGVRGPDPSEVVGVFAMAVHDADGGGPLPPRLYVGGRFSSIGGSDVSGVACLDGAGWVPVGGVGFGTVVRALASYDADGEGPQAPALYAGGEFTAVAGVPAANVARWDGAAWAPLLAGVQGMVRALAPFDPDSAGPLTPRLAIGGDFNAVNGSPDFGSGLAVWNGSAFILPPGYPGSVRALLDADPDGPGGRYVRSLVLAGDRGLFYSANGGALRTASSLTNLWGLTLFDPDGAGSAPPQLTFVASLDGVFRAFRWDGIRSVGLGPAAPSGALATFDDDGPGPLPAALYTGGVTWRTGPGRFGAPRPPEILRQPAGVIARRSRPATFTVLAQGGPGLVYEWRHDGVPIPASPRILGAGTPRLTIDPLIPSDEGSYTCVVSDGCANLTSEGALLEVHPAADFNLDGFVDQFDDIDFLACVDGLGCPPGGAADFDRDGTVSLADEDAFMRAFQLGV